jgi:hypothetical protein
VYYLDHYDSTKPQFSVNGDYDPGRTSLARTTNPAVTLRSEQPDVREPYATGLPLPTKVGNTYYLSGNYFVNGNLFLGGTDEARVPANHTATIYVTGSLFMYSDSEFHIEEGGALRVFVAGSTALLGKVDNSGTPQAFQYFGLPGNTTVTLNQPGSWFVGNFFAPQATFACTSASSTTDFAGSLSVSNLVLNRTYNFHYDESLARTGPRRGFVVAQWSEL